MDEQKTAARKRLKLVTKDSVIAKSERCIATMQRYLEQGRALNIAVSGKDSTTVLTLALEAYRRAGPGAPTLRVRSSDTLVENPEVRRLMRQLHTAVEAWSREVGLPVDNQIVSPSMSGNYLVRIIAGRKLPTYRERGAAGSDCAVDMKVVPGQRSLKTINAELADKGLDPVITVLGTRFDESARRASNMKARGESDVQVVNNTLSPIAHWSTEEVFWFLTMAPRIPELPAFMDYGDLLTFYADASGDGCALVAFGAEKKQGQSQCSTRSGCWTCLKVQKDASAEAMMRQDRYAYFRPLSQLRSFLDNIQWDFGRRRWIMRSPDPVTGYIAVHPNNFNYQTCSDLLRAVVTADRDEYLRARSVAEALDAGDIEHTPENRILAESQFYNLPPESVIAIDYLWASDAFAPRPFEAVRLWNDIWNNGHSFYLPDVEYFPKIDMPEKRWLPGDLSGADQTQFVSTSMAFMTAFDAEGTLYDYDPVERTVKHKAYWRESERFDVDPDGAALVLGLEMNHLMRCNETMSPLYALDYWLRMGTVTLSKGYANQLSAFRHRASFMIANGLTGAFDIENYADRMITDANHNALRTQAETELDRQRHMLAVTEDHEAELDRLLHLEAALSVYLDAAEYVGAKHPSFDGINIASALRRARLKMARIYGRRSINDIPAFVSRRRATTLERARTAFELCIKGTDYSATSDGFPIYIDAAAQLLRTADTSASSDNPIDISAIHTQRSMTL